MSLPPFNVEQQHSFYLIIPGQNLISYSETKSKNNTLTKRKEMSTVSVPPNLSSPRDDAHHLHKAFKGKIHYSSGVF